MSASPRVSFQEPLPSPPRAAPSPPRSPSPRHTCRAAAPPPPADPSKHWVWVLDPENSEEARVRILSGFSGRADMIPQRPGHWELRNRPPQPQKFFADAPVQSLAEIMAQQKAGIGPEAAAAPAPATRPPPPRPALIPRAVLLKGGAAAAPRVQTWMSQKAQEEEQREFRRADCMLQMDEEARARRARVAGAGPAPSHRRRERIQIGLVHSAPTYRGSGPKRPPPPTLNLAGMLEAMKI